MRLGCASAVICEYKKGTEKHFSPLSTGEFKGRLPSFLGWMFLGIEVGKNEWLR